MKKVKLNAQQRKIFGRKVKKLRKEGLLPANVYGKKVKSQAVKVDLKEFLEVYKQTGETGIVDLSLGGRSKTRPVLIHNLQKHPVTDRLFHVDFYQVDLSEKVQVAIPIEMIGEAPAVAKGGVLVQQLGEVEVEALPANLPEKFEVNVISLEEIGQSIAIKDLKVDKAKFKILVDDEDQLVVKIEEPSKEEEEKPAEEEVEEGKPEEKKAKEEPKTDRKEATQKAQKETESTEKGKTSEGKKAGLQKEKGEAEKKKLPQKSSREKK